MSWKFIIPAVATAGAFVLGYKHGKELTDEFLKDLVKKGVFSEEEVAEYKAQQASY